MHFVLATIGSLGDLHPILALAHALRERGHTVVIATSECYREKISRLGFAFAPLRPEVSIMDPELVRRVMDGTGGSKFLLKHLMLPAVGDMLQDLTVATRGTDLLVTNELVYAAPFVAEQTGLRWVSYSLAPMSFFSTHDPSVPPMPGGGEWMHDLPPWAVGLCNRFAAGITYHWWRPVRRLRRQLGLPAGGNPLFKGKHSPLLDLALFSSVLQPPQPDWPASTRQTGFCFYDEPNFDPNPTPGAAGQFQRLPKPVAEFLQSGEPPLVFTLGSAAVYSANDFYEQSADAARLLGRRALLLLGKNPSPPNLPPTILAWDYLPYAGIFPFASAVIHQGGVGTTAQTLRAGRPMLIVPFAHDQFDNAARIVRMGAGRALPRHRYQSSRVAAELQPLLSSDSYSTTTARLAKIIGVENGLVRTCEAIEQAAAKSSLPARET